jgi:tetratricopeptide (TPR) repeat protein
MRAYASFIRAVDLDERARAAFRAASAARGELSERDARLLDALAPSFLDPPRWRETADLLEAFLRERPRDVLGWEALGFARVKLGDYEASERAFSKEIEIDPRAGLAYDLEAQFATARQDDERAKSLLGTCVRQVPGAMRCRIDIALLLAASGNCAEADQQARDALAIDPDSPRALAARARATAALGATNDVVSGFLQKRRKSVPAEMRRALEMEDAFLLAKRTGDFSAALVALDPAILGGDELSSTDATRFTLARAETLWEIGETREAAKLASTYLRLETTRPLPERSATDGTGRMLSFLRAAGEITPKEQTTRRDDWIAAWRARHTETEWKTEVGPNIWSSAFEPVGLPTNEEGRVALDAAKALGIDISPHSSVNADPTARDAYAAVGEVLMTVDRLDEAEKLLRRATRSCVIAPDQIARLALGDLLARRGNTDEACATYAKIEKDWGHAKPRSITAVAGRAAAKKIHCPVL